MESWKNGLIPTRDSGNSFPALMSSLIGITIDLMVALILKNLKLLNKHSGENCNQKPSLALETDCLGCENMRKAIVLYIVIIVVI